MLENEQLFDVYFSYGFLLHFELKPLKIGQRADGNMCSDRILILTYALCMMTERESTYIQANREHDFPLSSLNNFYPFLNAPNS